MACRTYVSHKGAIALTCGRARREQVLRCIVCNCPSFLTTIRLCDYPLEGKKRYKTCDASVCIEHAYHIEPETDYCPKHAALVQREKA